MTRFVDRFKELAKLVEYAENGFYPVLAVYGPEGCGKTRLLREFIDRVRGRENFVAIYIDALEDRDPDRVLSTSLSLADAVRDFVSLLPLPVGRSLATNIAKLVQHLEKRVRFRGKHAVIAIDDVVRSIGLEAVDIYVKNLLNIIEDLLWRYGASSVFIVITTSEGLSRYVLARHRYSYDRLLWNLDRDSFKELIHELRPPKGIDSDLVYEYTGGNPGKLMEIALGYRWGLEEWFRDIVAKVRVLVSDILDDNRLVEVVEDIDRLSKYTDLAKVLIEKNLVVDIRSIPLGQGVAPCRDLGIGTEYAWQIPAYRIALKKILEHRASR